MPEDYVYSKEETDQFIMNQALVAAERDSERNLKSFEVLVESGQFRNAMEVYCRGTEFIKIDLMKCRSISDKDVFRECENDVLNVMSDFIKTTGDMLEKACST